METSRPVTVVTVTDTVAKLKGEIDASHESFLKETESIAADFAVLGLPEQHAPSIEPFIETIRAHYGRILNDNALQLSASVREKLGAMDLFSMKQRLKDIKLKCNALAGEVNTLLLAKKKIAGQRTAKEYERLKLQLNIFSVAECLGYILSFLALGDNYALAAIWGTLLGTGQTTGIKALVLWMRDGSGAALGKTTKRLVWAAVALVATALGLLRYASIQASGDNGFAQSAFAPFVFILISYFLISVLALYVWHHYPTKDEQVKLRETANLDQEIARKEAELKQCQEEVKQLTGDCNTVEQVHTLLVLASKDFYHRVNSHFLFAVGTFKSTNRITRTDDITPVCYSQPVRPLDMPNYKAWETGGEYHQPNTDNP